MKKVYCIIYDNDDINLVVAELFLHENKAIQEKNALQQLTNHKIKVRSLLVNEDSGINWK